MKLAERLIRFLSIYEMGRHKSEMTDTVKELEPRITEHIWKIWAYHAERPQDVNTWLKSLNKHLKKFRKYNVPKGSSGKNLDREYLIDKLVTEPFEHSGDIEVLVGEWCDEGFPSVFVPENRIQDLQNFASKYVDLILSTSGKMGISSFDKLL